MKALKTVLVISILMWAGIVASGQDKGQAAESTGIEESAVSAAGAERDEEAGRIKTITGISVAIIDFESKAPGNPELGSQISDILTARLSIYDQFRLVERRRLEDLLKEHQLNLTGMVETTDAIKAGKLAGARIMIFGRAFPVGKDMYLVAKIVSTETSRVKGVVAKGKLEGDLSETIDLLVKKLAEGLEKWAPELLPKEEKLVNKVAQLKKKLKGKDLPTLAVFISESHINRRIADPAAETEMIKILKEVGFSIKETTGKNLPQWAKDFMKNPDGPVPSDFNQVDIIITGEGVSEFGARMGGLVSCLARLEVRVVSRKDNNEILLADRTTRRVVDISEIIASKTALQAAGHEMAIKVIEQIAKNISDEKAPAKKGSAKDDSAK